MGFFGVWLVVLGGGEFCLLCFSLVVVILVLLYFWPGFGMLWQRSAELPPYSLGSFLPSPSTGGGNALKSITRKPKPDFSLNFAMQSSRKLLSELSVPNPFS